MQNIFLSTTGQFKFFADKSLSQDFNKVAPVVETGLTRMKGMTFNEFLNSSQFDTQKLYLYGEPLPSHLKCLFLKPSFLNKYELTSELLWVSLRYGSVSPMHYDLTEGCLIQLCGEKTVHLIDSVECFDQLKPYPVGHVHDRQSTLRLDELPSSIEIQTAVLTSGDLLYIPHAHWHYVYSENESISISLRFNPFEKILKRIAIEETACQQLTIHAAKIIIQQLLNDLPLHVQTAYKRRSKLFTNP